MQQFGFLFYFPEFSFSFPNISQICPVFLLNISRFVALIFIVFFPEYFKFFCEKKIFVISQIQLDHWAGRKRNWAICSRILTVFKRKICDKTRKRVLCRWNELTATLIISSLGFLALNQHKMLFLLYLSCYFGVYNS